MTALRESRGLGTALTAALWLVGVLMIFLFMLAGAAVYVLFSLFATLLVFVDLPANLFLLIGQGVGSLVGAVYVLWSIAVVSSAYLHAQEHSGETGDVD